MWRGLVPQTSSFGGAGWTTLSRHQVRPEHAPCDGRQPARTWGVPGCLAEGFECSLYFRAPLTYSAWTHQVTAVPGGRRCRPPGDCLGQLLPTCPARRAHAQPSPSRTRAPRVVGGGLPGTQGALRLFGGWTTQPQTRWMSRALCREGPFGDACALPRRTLRPAPRGASRPAAACGLRPPLCRQDAPRPPRPPIRFRLAGLPVWVISRQQPHSEWSSVTCFCHLAGCIPVPRVRCAMAQAAFCVSVQRPVDVRAGPSVPLLRTTLL